MGLLSRQKGKTFERVIAAELRKRWAGATIHRSSQADRAYAADVVIEGEAPQLLRELWLEMEDAREPNPRKKLEQAERDCTRLLTKSGSAPGYQLRIPVIIWHRYRERSIQATMRLSTLQYLRWALDVRDPSPVDGALVTISLGDFLDLLQWRIANVLLTQ